MAIKRDKHDNKGIREKLAMRREALAWLADKGVTAPVVLETHGGKGAIWKQLYAGFEGTVFEKNPSKSASLAKQRPSWAVYQCDCIRSLEIGTGNHLAYNLIDIDPYGSSLEVIQAFFAGNQQYTPKRVAIVVNDGLRQQLSMKGGWSAKVLEDIVNKYGNELHGIYLDVLFEAVEELVSKVGYEVVTQRGFYGGHKKQMTHYMVGLVSK